MSDRADQPPVPGNVQVRVDAEACIAAGQCEMLEPDVFRVDDDTAVAVVLGPGTLPLDRAEIAADRCPAGAISIVQAG